jgi:hypothetical protein
MSGLVDSCDLELLQESNKTGKKLTISMSGLVDSFDLELLQKSNKTEEKTYNFNVWSSGFL